MKLAPPLAAPDKIFTLWFSDFKNPLIAGPGPTYAISMEPAKMDSITWGPASNNIGSITLLFPIWFSNIPLTIVWAKTNI